MLIFPSSMPSCHDTYQYGWSLNYKWIQTTHIWIVENQSAGIDMAIILNRSSAFGIYSQSLCIEMSVSLSCFTSKKLIKLEQNNLKHCIIYLKSATDINISLALLNICRNSKGLVLSQSSSFLIRSSSLFSRFVSPSFLTIWPPSSWFSHHMEKMLNSCSYFFLFKWEKLLSFFNVI
jgi:hypothetical protein